MTDPSTSEGAPLRVLGGRYRLDRYIGRGGMGEVFAATHLSTGARVAIKRLLPEHAADEAVCRRFVREARAATAIRHPNVIVVHDVFDDEDGAPVMVMELLEGESLAQRMQRVGALSVRESALLFLDVARAVCAAHERGVVHRDLKPDNIFLSRDRAGRPLATVLDFGIAKILRQNDLHAHSYGSSTHTGSIIGTVRYMSHEQAMGQDVDERTDVWSFAVTMVETLSGRRPLHYETLSEMFVAMLQQRVPKAHSMISGLPAPLASMLDACLHKERDKRAPNLKQAVTVLESYLARPDAHAARPMQRRGWLVGLCLLAALVCLAVLSQRGLQTAPVLLHTAPVQARSPAPLSASVGGSLPTATPAPSASPPAPGEAAVRAAEVAPVAPPPAPSAAAAAERDAGPKHARAHPSRVAIHGASGPPPSPEPPKTPEPFRHSPIIETLPE